MSDTQMGAMAEALAEARLAGAAGEVPVGAVVVDASGAIIARGRNAMRARCDPTAHAEVLALREACSVRGSARLVDCDLYVTLEPCAMCAGAISLARVRRLYYGAEDAKGGAVDNGVCFFDAASCFHRPEVYGGISATASAELLREFFIDRRG